MGIKKALGRLGGVFRKVGGKIEDRNDRRVAELVSAALEQADEDDVLEGLTSDVMDAIAEKYELQVKLVKKPKVDPS